MSCPAWLSRVEVKNNKVLLCAATKASGVLTLEKGFVVNDAFASTRITEQIRRL